MSRDHAARAQPLGYQYQFDYSLFLILDRIEPHFAIRIEGLDDIEGWNQGQLLELLQGKHHLEKDVNLNNRNPDLWKTIGIWSEHVKESRIVPAETILTLFTTAKAPMNTIASLLRSDDNRKPKLACDKLRAIANQKPAKKLREACNAFKNLTSHQQETLVASIHILEQSPNILDIRKKIENYLQAIRVEADRVKAFEQLEGWWNDEVIKHLLNNSKDLISKEKVGNQLALIVRDYTIPLPDNWRNKKIPFDQNWNEERFIRQLHAIEAEEEIIHLAYQDRWRAFYQRHDWKENFYMSPKELEDYEDELKEEWQRIRGHLKKSFKDMYNCHIDEATEDLLKKFGYELYQKIDEDVNIPVHQDFIAKYMIRGSYHLLADQTSSCVCWHPKFPEIEKASVSDDIVNTAEQAPSTEES